MRNGPLVGQQISKPDGLYADKETFEAKAQKVYMNSPVEGQLIMMQKKLQLL